jgi:predicted  nucleic acid-binding Zn-ribbon protein
MESTMGEYQCTKCGETVMLPVGDDTLFGCQQCGGEEGEMNYAMHNSKGEPQMPTRLHRVSATLLVPHAITGVARSNRNSSFKAGFTKD